MAFDKQAAADRARRQWADRTEAERKAHAASMSAARWRKLRSRAARRQATAAARAALAESRLTALD